MHGTQERLYPREAGWEKRTSGGNTWFHLNLKIALGTVGHTGQPLRFPHLASCLYACQLSSQLSGHSVSYVSTDHQFNINWMPRKQLVSWVICLQLCLLEPMMFFQATDVCYFIWHFQISLPCHVQMLKNKTLWA